MADILLVEDHDAVRVALRHILVRAGHTVREAADGREARRLIHERVPDLLVSDVYMPEMDGIELLTHLHKEFPSLRIIIMSGGGNLPSGDVLDIARSLGASTTLLKPIDAEQLRAAVTASLT